VALAGQERPELTSALGISTSVLVCGSVVAGASLSLVSLAGSMVFRHSVLRLPQCAGALMASALVTGAFVLAPEQPRQQAFICERHHSVAACRVW